MVQQNVLIALQRMVECTLGEFSSIQTIFWIYYRSMLFQGLDTFNEDELRMLRDEELAHLTRESNHQLQCVWQNEGLQDILSSMIEVKKQIYALYS